ncbi:hypothetical protein I79_005947 [Cricetulus griseus]|uniref:Uncharacterized protein n=1 Tax=Cricetulus griseus TaxID=10029 RepID=G3H6I6_CRIGR|nr:hypothetical protein I79_005947 [Cricetulus griseus]
MEKPTKHGDSLKTAGSLEPVKHPSTATVSSPSSCFCFYSHRAGSRDSFSGIPED